MFETMRFHERPDGLSVCVSETGNAIAQPLGRGIGVAKLHQERPDPSDATCHLLAWTLYQFMCSEAAVEHGKGWSA